MMKRVLVILGMIVIPLVSMAQKEAYNWVFGNNIKLDFSTSPPKPTFSALTFGNNSVPNVGYNVESSTSVSDATGTLLFYTTGQYLYNGFTNANVSSTLNTTLDASQGNLVIPMKSNANKFALFTVDALPVSCGGSAEFGSGRGATMYRVDVNQGASTVGVTSLGQVSGTAATVIEGQAACPTATAGEYWYVVHETGNTRFKVYKVNTNGTDPTITLDHNNDVGSTFNGCAYINMKFNSCFTQLAVAYGATPGGTGNVVVFDFNKTSGAITNPQSFTIGGAYGLEFSSLDATGKSYLYISQSELASSNSLYRGQISAAGVVTAPTVFAALNGNSNNGSGDLTKTGHLQLGPDGDIYVADKLSYSNLNGTVENYVGAILNAETAGATFNSKYIVIDDQASGAQYLHVGMGLPTFLKSLVSDVVDVSVGGITVDDVPVCQDDSKILDFTTTSTVLDLPDWVVKDPSGATVLSLNDVNSVTVPFIYAGGGNYSVSVTYALLCGGSKTVNKTINVKAKITPGYTLPATVCPAGTLITGTAGTGGTPANYIWYNSDGTTVLASGVSTYNYIGTLPKTLFVQDGSSAIGPYTVGETVTNFSNSVNPSGGWQLSTPFSANKDLLLSSVTVKVIDPNSNGYCSSNYTFTIKVQKGGVDVAGLSFTNPATNGCNKSIVVPVNFSIPAGSGYTLVLVPVTPGSATFKASLREYGTTPQSWSDAGGLITITNTLGGGWSGSGPFADWKVSQPKPCTVKTQINLVDNCCTQAIPTLTPGPTATACAGGSVVLTAGPNGATGTVNYKWYKNGNYVTPVQNSTSTTYTATSIAAGDYYEVEISSSGGCSSTSATRTKVTFSITPVPAQPSAITGSATPCISTQAYSVTNVAGVTYTWTVSGGGTITGTGNTASVNWTTAGGPYTVTATPSNTCGNGTARTLTVNVSTVPAQPSTITGSTTPCPGTQAYSVTNVAGVTYTWTVSGGGTITGTGNTASVNWTTSGGPYTITATPSNACGNGTARTLTVNVGAVPAQPSTITGSTTPCISTQAYNVTNVAGVTYTWTVSGGGTITGSGNTASVNWTTAGGPYTVTATPSNTCGNGTARTLSVTVSTVPAQPSTITGSATPCLGTQAYSVTNVAGVTYTWTVSGGGTITGTGNTASVNWTTAGGPYTVTATPSNTCGNGTARTLTVNVSTVPAQPSTITGSTTPCPGTQAYSVTNVAGVTYTWTVSGGGTITGTGNTASVNWTTSGGPYTITATPSNTCGNGTARTLTVNVGAVPAQPSAITGSTTPCLSTQAYNVTNVAGVTYTWTVSGGGTITGSGNTASVNWTAAGTYTVTATPSNTCGNGTARTLSVTVSTVPAQPSTITGSATPCLGTQAYSVTNVAGVTYTWTVSGGGTITGTGNTASVNWTTVGTYTVTTTPSNTCGNGTARTLSVTVSDVPAQPSTITGSATPCLGTQAYSVTNVAGVTYTWTVSGGGTITSTGNTASINWTTAGGPYTVTATPSNACGNGTARTLTVNVSTVPAQPSVISGNATSCFGSQPYSVTNVAGVTYAWTVSGGGSITGTGNTASVNWTTAGTYTITATPSNACGNGAARTLSVTVNSGASATASAITGSASPCLGTQAYSIVNNPSLTYAWTVSGGGTVTGTGNTASVNWTTAGTYTLTVTPSNTCGPGTPSQLTVIVSDVPAQPSVIAGSATPCLGSQNYNVTNVAGVTYAWTVSGGGTITGTGNTASVNWTTAGTYTITATPSNTCGNGTARTLSVTVSDVPAQASVITGNATPCLGTQAYSVTNVAGVTYAWTVSGGGTVTGTGNTASVVWATPGTYTLTATPSNACGNGLARTLSVTITSGASASAGAITGSTDICTGTQSYSVPGGAGLTYVWSVTGGGTITNGTTVNPSVNWTAAGNWVLTCTPFNTCGAGTPSTLNVTVNGNPTISNTTLTETICSGSPTTALTLTSDISGSTFAWTATTSASITGFTASATSVTSIPSQTLVNGGTTQGDVIYLVSVTSSKGCPGTGTKNYIVKVDPPAIADVTSTSVSSCNPIQTLPGVNPPSGTVSWVKLTGAGTVAIPGSAGSTVTGMLAGETGTFQMTVTSGLCIKQSSIVTVTRSSDETPTVSINVDKTVVCEGSTVTFTASASGGNLSTRTFTFMDASGTILQAASLSNTYTTGVLTAGVGVKVMMTANSSCLAPGASQTPESAVKAVSVDKAPSTPVFVTPATTPYTVCSTSQPLALQPLTTGSAAWTIDNSGTFQGATPTGANATAISLVQGQSYNVKVVVTNGVCTAAPSASVVLNVAGNVSVAISAATKTDLCEGQSLILNGLATGAVITKYEWFKNNGTTGNTSTSVSIPSTLVSDAGTYELRATSSCGVTPSNQITVKVNVASKNDRIVDDVKGCQGTDVDVTVNLSQVGVSYQAFINGIAAGTKISGNGFNLDVPVSSSSLVAGTNDVVIRVLGCDTVDLLDHAVVSILGKASSITGASKVCGGEASSVPYSITPVIGATDYLWAASPSSVTVQTGSSSTLANFSAVTGTSDVTTIISVQPSIGGTFTCESPISKSVTWRPAYNGVTISGKADKVCVKDEITLELSNFNADGFNIISPYPKSEVDTVSTSPTTWVATFLKSGVYTFNIKPSASPCTVLPDSVITVTVFDKPVADAGGDIELEDFATIDLDGSGSSQSTPSIYNYEWTSPNLNPGIVNPNVISTQANPKGLVTNYFLTVSYKDPALNGCESVDVKEVVIDLQVKTPNVFTPNDDNIHDTFVLPNIEFFPNSIMYIYNQWGELIFKSKPNYFNNPWDGKRNGKECTMGTYYYVLELHATGYKTRTGAVSIVR